MQCPNAILIDSKLLNKDTFWHIDRNKPFKLKTQVKNGGVGHVNAASKRAVLDPELQGLKPDALIQILRSKIAEKTQNSDRFTSVYKLFDRPNQGLSKEKLKEKLRSWGVVPGENDFDALFDQWGARRGVIDFNFFLGRVMGSDYTDSDASTVHSQWRFEPAKKKTMTQRQTQRASYALDQHLQQKRKRRLESKHDPETSKAHRSILDKLGQASALSGQTEVEQLRKLLRKHQMPSSGILTIHQFHDVLMMGLGLRPTRHQLQQLVHVYGRGHHGKIAVFELLKDSSSSAGMGAHRLRHSQSTHIGQRTEYRVKGTVRTRRRRQQGRELFVSAQDLHRGMNAGAHLPKLKMNTGVGKSKSLPAFIGGGQQLRQQRVGAPATNPEGAVTNGRGRDEALRKLRLEKEILQLKAQILDERINTHQN